jgi:hypothetical protein
VHVFVRRPELPRINPIRKMEQAGARNDDLRHNRCCWWQRLKLPLLLRRRQLHLSHLCLAESLAQCAQCTATINKHSVKRDAAAAAVTISTNCYQRLPALCIGTCRHRC